MRDNVSARYLSLSLVLSSSCSMASPSLLESSNWPEKMAHHNAAAMTKTNSKDKGINKNIESSIITPLLSGPAELLEPYVGYKDAKNYTQLKAMITALRSQQPMERPNQSPLKASLTSARLQSHTDFV